MVLLIPDRQCGRTESSAIKVEQPGAGLVVEELHIGDRRICDGDSYGRAAGFNDLRLTFGHADLGLRLSHNLD